MKVRKISHDSFDERQLIYEMDSLNSSINKENNKLTEEFDHKFEYHPMMKSYSIRTINNFDEQTIRRDFASTVELNKPYKTYFDPETQKQLLKDPYLSHFLLVSIHIFRQHRQSRLRKIVNSC